MFAHHRNDGVLGLLGVVNEQRAPPPYRIQGWVGCGDRATGLTLQ